jgi:amidohydrolase
MSNPDAGSGVMNAELERRMIQIRRHLHRNPELSNQEREAEPLGGRRVMEEGLLDDIDAAIGIHVDPYTPTGRIAVGSGPYTLASDIFDVVVTGNFAHAAKPSKGVDALAIACSMVGELQKIVSREIDPYDPLVISVTGLEAGDACNVIAAEAKLRGTIRSGHEETRRRAWHRLGQILEGVAALHNARVNIQLQRGEPPVVNDPDMVEIVRRAGAYLLGQEKRVERPGMDGRGRFCLLQ